MLFSIQPGKEAVDPTDAETEPTERALFLTSEAQDKLTERILLERQAYVHETHVVTTPLITVLHRVPDGHHVGMYVDVRFPSISRIPEIRIPLTIHDGRTADDTLVILRYE